MCQLTRVSLCLFRNLPAKSQEETLRHKMEYEEMVAGAKRRGERTHTLTLTQTSLPPSCCDLIGPDRSVGAKC